MICPICTVEYRSGITRCADCKVALVAALPETDSPQAYTVLWRGEDPALRDTLCLELERAGIEYGDTPLEVFLRNSGDPFHLSPGPQFGFVISVRSADSRTARTILAKLLDEEPADLEIPAQDAAPAKEPPLVYVTEEHPAFEVWRGKDEQVSEFLTAALQENEIPMHLEFSGDETGINVSAANEKRAREIVKEIVEGEPPE